MAARNRCLFSNPPRPQARARTRSRLCCGSGVGACGSADCGGLVGLVTRRTATVSGCDNYKTNGCRFEYTYLLGPVDCKGRAAKMGLPSLSGLSDTEARQALGVILAAQALQSTGPSR